MSDYCESSSLSMCSLEGSVVGGWSFVLGYTSSEMGNMVAAYYGSLDLSVTSVWLSGSGGTVRFSRVPFVWVVSRIVLKAERICTRVLEM